jgi:hypothetical protein
MSIISSNAIVSKLYTAIQGRTRNEGANVAGREGEATPAAQAGGFRLPNSATPRGDWVLSENINPQNFESNSPRGTYLNLVI